RIVAAPRLLQKSDDPYDSDEEQQVEEIQHRNWHSCIAREGALYIMGGFDGKSYLRDVVQVDTNSKKWKVIHLPLAQAPAGRMSHSATMYHDSMIVFGGQDSSYKNLNDVFELQFSDSEKQDVQTEVQNEVESANQKPSVTTKTGG